jgi:AcrR family transcriptional regulator
MTVSPLAELLAEDVEAFDPTAERILDGAYEELLEHGLRRTSMDAIARRAGVGRATVFRRFANREALLTAVVAREVRGFIATVDRAIAHIDTPQDRVVPGFLAFVTELRSHPLLQRLLLTDPADVLPLVTRDADAPLGLARHYLAGQVRHAVADGAPIAADPDELGELLARIAMSFALTPRSVIALDDPERLAETVRDTIVPLMFGAGR